MLHSFSDVVCLFPFSFQGMVFLHSCSQLWRSLISSIGNVVSLLVALLCSGRGITGESLRDLKTDIEHIVI